MIHEVTELVAAHLGHATHGVNALLPGVPLKSGDTTPANVGAIAHEFADDWLTADQEPPVVPALIVVVRNNPDADLSSGHRTVEMSQSRDVLIGVTYAARDALGATTRRTGSYTLKAVRQSLAQLTGSRNISQADRTLRGVVVASIGRMQEVPLAPSQGRGGLVGMVLAHAVVIDTDV